MHGTVAQIVWQREICSVSSQRFQHFQFTSDCRNMHSCSTTTISLSVRVKSRLQHGMNFLCVACQTGLYKRGTTFFIHGLQSEEDFCQAPVPVSLIVNAIVSLVCSLLFQNTRIRRTLKCHVIKYVYTAELGHNIMMEQISY